MDSVRSSAQQWLDKTSDITSSPILSNPTVIAITLVAVLIPLVFYVESLGKSLPVVSSQASKSTGAIHESKGNKKDG